MKGAGLSALPCGVKSRCRRVDICNGLFVNRRMLFLQEIAKRSASRMTIKAKILCLVGAFAVLAAAITGLGLKTMADYSRAIQNYRHASANALNGERLNRYLTAAALDGTRLYIAPDQAAAEAAAGRIDIRADELSGFVNAWKGQLKAGELPEFDAVSGWVLDMARDGHELARIARTDGLPAARAYGDHPQYRAYREDMQSRLDAMVARLSEQQSLSQTELTRFESFRSLQFMLMAVAGILGLLGASLWLAIDSISRPLSQVRQSMVQISEGAYDTPIPGGRMSAEIGQLWGALDVLRRHAVEADRLTRLRLEEEKSMRELVLD